MSIARGYLRLVAVVWLCVHAASLLVSAPAACCRSHGEERHPGDETVSQAGGDTPCPMPDETGAACPMHRKGRGAAAGTRASVPTLRCGCDTSATFTVFATAAVLTSAPSVILPASCELRMAALHERVPDHPDAPDSPPPRA